MGVEEAYRWKDSVQSEAEIRIWFADGVANGLRPWFTKFAGVLRDRRWLGVVEEIYRWHHGAERYLRNEEPLARVALVYSQQTAHYYGGEQARANEVATDLRPLTPATRDDRMPIATDVDYLEFGVPVAPVQPPATIAGLMIAHSGKCDPAVTPPLTMAQRK